MGSRSACGRLGRGAASGLGVVYCPREIGRGHCAAVPPPLVRAARRAVRVLRTGKLKMSARDAARLLGLSHQRVHQLTQEESAR